MKQPTSFTTTIRRRYDGSSYNFFTASAERRAFEYVDVTIRVEVRAWSDGLPHFGLCVAAAPACHPHTGEAIFREEDEVALSPADVTALRRECAEYFARVEEERRREIVAGYVYGVHGLVDDPFPDYDAAEVAHVGFRSEPVYYADAA